MRIFNLLLIAAWSSQSFAWKGTVKIRASEDLQAASTFEYTYTEVKDITKNQPNVHKVATKGKAVCQAELMNAIFVGPAIEVTCRSKDNPDFKAKGISVCPLGGQLTVENKKEFLSLTFDCDAPAPTPSSRQHD